MKSPEELDLSEPKSKTTTEGSPEAVSLKIKAPRAVMLDEPNVKSAKSVKAVVELVVGSTLVKEPPFAEYPVPETSFELV